MQIISLTVFLPHYITWAEMVDVASKVKLGKSSTGRFKAEHLLHGCPKLLHHFHFLFNGMLQHSFVPTDLLMGCITPIVKNPQGDLSDPASYRGITHSCLPAKLYE